MEWEHLGEQHLQLMRVLRSGPAGSAQSSPGVDY
jgi:hypothetical protein